MKKSILITGVSGSGKSSLCQKLRQMGYRAYDIDDVEGLFSMVNKQTKQPIIDHENDNLTKVQNMDWICDIDRLRKIIDEEKSGVAFYCGNAANLDEIWVLFDTVFLLTAEPEIIRQRLSSRTSNDFGKTKEIQDWLLSRKEQWEDEMGLKGAKTIDANQDLDIVASEIVRSN